MGPVHLRKRRQGDDLSLHHVTPQQEGHPICKPGEGSSPGHDQAGTLILDFPDPRTMRNTFLLFKPPGLWYFVKVVSPQGLAYQITKQLGD